MKVKIYIVKTFLLVLFFCGCGKRNFFPDPDDPGLSLLTSYGFNIGTFYLNDVAYINSYRSNFLRGIVNSAPRVTKYKTSSTSDTLILSWPIGINNNGDVDYNSPYLMISLLMPVPKFFTKADFIAMSGQQFAANTNAVILQPSYYGSDTLSGLCNIYFVKINQTQPSDSSAPRIFLSGLFNGNIGDSTLITKGRFDFVVNTDNLNF